MAGRTNKKGIAAKKKQLQKQAGRSKGEKKFNYPSRKVTLEQAKELGFVGAKTNPSGSTYNRFIRGRKICWDTRLKVDPDGYALTKLPSGGLEFIEVPISGWLRKKLSKNAKS